jgi:hypothetical protein
MVQLPVLPEFGNGILERTEKEVVKGSFEAPSQHLHGDGGEKQQKCWSE